MKTFKCILASIVCCAMMTPCVLAQAQPDATAPTILRPPVPGKPDNDSPVLVSILLALGVVGVVMMANLMASKRSHQD
jgi:hypothetical protein